MPAWDANSNLVALYDSQDMGEAAACEYSPYGEVLRATGAYAQENPFGYATKLRDEHTGLVNYGYRNYSPKQGRFINRDPIEEAGGVNLYAFTENDPVNQTDIRGLSGDSRRFEIYSPFEIYLLPGSFEIWSAFYYDPFPGLGYYYEPFMDPGSIPGPADSGEAAQRRRHNAQIEASRQANVARAQTKALRSQLRANTEDVMASADLPNGNRLGNQPVDDSDNAGAILLDDNTLVLSDGTVVPGGPSLVNRGTRRVRGSSGGGTDMGTTVRNAEIALMQRVLKYGKGGSSPNARQYDRAVRHLKNFRRANGLSAPRGPVHTELRPVLRHEGVGYHGRQQSGKKSPSATNPQSALNQSHQISPNSPRRIGVDPVSGEIVVFHHTTGNVFHGHLRNWGNISPAMRNALIRNGVFTPKGRPVIPNPTGGVPASLIPPTD